MSVRPSIPSTLLSLLRATNAVYTTLFFLILNLIIPLSSPSPTAPHTHTHTDGFLFDDGDAILQVSLPEFVQLVDAGAFQTLGFAALRIAELLANEEEGPNGALDADVRRKLELWEIPATHVTGTSFGFEVRIKSIILDW